MGGWLKPEQDETTTSPVPAVLSSDFAVLSVCADTIRVNPIGIPGSTPYGRPHRHMLRIRAPTSTRTVRESCLPFGPVAATGQVVHSKSCNNVTGIKRVREA